MWRGDLVVSEPQVAIWVFINEVDEGFHAVVIAIKCAGVAAVHQVVAKGFDVLARNEGCAIIEGDAVAFAFIDEIACR